MAVGGSVVRHRPVDHLDKTLCSACGTTLRNVDDLLEECPAPVSAKVNVVIVDGAVSVWRQSYDAMVYSEGCERDGADVSVIYNVEIKEGGEDGPNQ